MSNQTPDRLLSPLPGRKERFREVTLVEQHEILFRFLEEIYDEVRALRDRLDAEGGR